MHSLCIGLILSLIFLPARIFGISYEMADFNFFAGPAPHRIALTWTDDPARTQTVNWRTDASVFESYGEIAPATSTANFIRNIQRVRATTTPVQTESGSVRHHRVTFANLDPNTTYIYRIGGHRSWSPWHQFTTAADSTAGFSFLYLGDARGNLLPLWSRTIRSAFAQLPNARFIAHAGGLVTQGIRDRDWGEWFEAAGWINATIPSLPVPGISEYEDGRLTKYWRAHFALPFNGIPSRLGTNYVMDYQGAKLIALDSNGDIDAQASWMEKVLANNDRPWVIAMFHRSVYPEVAHDDAQRAIRKAWMPVFERHGVDMVLQGHYKGYARSAQTGAKRESPSPVYVASVSGVATADGRPAGIGDFDIPQLYQVVEVGRNALKFWAYTAVGALHDAFEIRRNANGKKDLLNLMESETLAQKTHHVNVPIPE